MSKKQRDIITQLKSDMRGDGYNTTITLGIKDRITEPLIVHRVYGYDTKAIDEYVKDIKNSKKYTMMSVAVTPDKSEMRHAQRIYNVRRADVMQKVLLAAKSIIADKWKKHQNTMKNARVSVVSEKYRYYNTHIPMVQINETGGITKYLTDEYLPLNHMPASDTPDALIPLFYKPGGHNSEFMPYDIKQELIPHTSLSVTVEGHVLPYGTAFYETVEINPATLESIFKLQYLARDCKLPRNERQYKINNINIINKLYDGISGIHVSGIGFDKEKQIHDALLWIFDAYTHYISANIPPEEATTPKAQTVTKTADNKRNKATTPKAQTVTKTADNKRNKATTPKAQTVTKHLKKNKIIAKKAG